jgi:two-component system, cell cycle sensor histidine kinase and response regulator CckA
LAPATRPSTPVAVGGEETVLLVEDQDEVRAVIARALRGHGYEVVEARDGVEALALVAARREPIDIVVTDLLMPRLSGGEMVARLRQDRPGLLAMFTSGYAHEAKLGPTDGKSRFVAKPYVPATLLGALRELLDGAREGNER